jgi:hypothetical protein
LNLIYLTDANADTICLLRCPVIPVPQIIMIAVRIIIIAIIIMPVAGEIALLLFIAFIILLEIMIYGNEG